MTQISPEAMAMAQRVTRNLTGRNRTNEIVVHLDEEELLLIGSVCAALDVSIEDFLRLSGVDEAERIQQSMLMTVAARTYEAE